MITDAEYEKWLQDPARHQNRVLLVELDYAAPGAGEGHDRFNGAHPSMNAVTSIRARTYDATFGELTFVQPSDQAGYSWEVWKNGERVRVTSDGDYQFTAPENSTVQLAAVSVRSDGSYSDPWIVTVQMRPRQDNFGGPGNWSDIGIGAGGNDVGTVYLATQDILMDNNQAYDGWIIGQPEIDDRLDDFLGVGDIEAHNLDPELDWLSLRWNGYECRWFLGDETWSRSDYRSIASTLIDNCRLIDYGKFQFDLMDGAQFLRRTFLAADTNKDHSAKSTINFIMTEAGLPPVTYFNVDQSSRDYKINIDMTTDTKIIDALVRITSSIGAYVRIGQSGGVEVYRPDVYAPPATTLTIDDIVPDDVSQIEVTPAYARVRVELGRDLPPATGFTGAFTGQLNEEKVVDTVLYQTFDAQTVLEERLRYYSRGHAVWEIPTREKAALIEVGNIIAVEHPKFTGQGLVTRINRAPLSQFSRVEIETL